MLETLMGKMGSQLYRYANGLDDSPVRGAADREPIKSCLLYTSCFAILQPHLFHRVPQLPRGGGQVQLGIRLVIGYAFFRKIYLEYLLTQGSFLPFSSRSAHGVWG